MAQKTSFDSKIVRQLAQLLDETNLNEIEYEANDCRVRVVRHLQTTQVLPPVTAPSMAHQGAMIKEFTPKTVPESAPAVADHPGAVKSPMVGNAYIAPEPGANHFIREGDTVEIGQTLLIIEAMKVMNPIKATRSGKVTKILVKDGDPVEFDEVLLIVE